MGNDEEKRTRGRRVRKKKNGPAVIFFIALGLLTALAWCLPLRPAVSEKEKRNLETFPDFSLSALADGSYFNHIGIWFSDTFPGRDAWIGADQRLKALHGTGDVVIYGALDAGDDIPLTDDEFEDTDDPEPTAAAETVSVEETPEPVSTPESAASPGTETTPEPEPTTEPTPEPQEDVWGGKVIEEEDLVTVGAVIQIGDSVFPFTSFSKTYSKAYATNINNAAELLKGRARVSSVLVLHSTTLLLPREYRDSIGCKPEEEVLNYVNKQLRDDVIAVDTYGSLLPHNGEYIYYRTDHHWTALGCYYAYVDWAKKAGFEPVPLEKYRELSFEPFYGSLYYKANQSGALKPDTVYAYEPPGDVHLYLQMGSKDSVTSRGYEQTLLTDVRGTDKYLTFLTGDLPLATFINNDITDGSACLIVKNSNGNPFCYYFPQHYQYTYVIDYRKYRNRSLSNFVDYYGVSDVIFCLSSGQAQSAGGNELLRGLIR